MMVSAERFAQGLTYADYKAQMTRNRERFEANEQALVIGAEDLAFFRQLPEPLHVLALAEDWCGDVIANLPVVARLAEASGKLDLRVFLRDQNLDLMDQYLLDGKHRSIPVFVFFDSDFRELGHWIERPARVSELQAAMRRELFASDPLLAAFAPDVSPSELPDAPRARLMQAFADFREQNRALSDREVVRELRELLVSGTVQRAGAEPIAPRSSIPSAPAATRAGGPAKVSITYCAACGYEPQTLALTSALMYAFTYDLAAIELIPWHDGAFDVAVNGELVHSMYRDGGFPAHELVIEAVRSQLVASS